MYKFYYVDMTVENNAFKLLIISFLLITALSFSRMVFAQDMPDTEVAPGGGTITEDTNTSANTTSNSFNPLWLLPLIAIPILLYLLWPRNKVNKMDLSQGYVGAKGGKSQDESLFETDFEKERKI